MKKFATRPEALAAAAPGQYILASYAVVTVAERGLLLGNPGSTWSECERKRPFHDVVAEIQSGWSDLDQVGGTP